MRLCFAVILFVCNGLQSCGESHDYRSPRGEETEEGNVTEALGLKPNQNFILRGRIVFQVQASTELRKSARLDLTEETSELFKITASVQSNVQFNVNDESIRIPSELLSANTDFGSYQVDTLRDNDMNICGRSGRERCREAVLRIYSAGTPKAGLWNSRDEYGAPIASASKNIGLGAEQAAEISVYTIPSSKRVLQLRDFSGANSKPVLIPISVDFSDAGAGDYNSEMIVEYGLR